VLGKERYERRERERERDIPKREKPTNFVAKVCSLQKLFVPESTFSLHRFIKSCELWNYFGAVGWGF
jgi:hypothetical protein